jgi:trk system potassium uptake protein TrkH
MTRAVDSLMRAVRPAVVLNMLGRLLLTLAALAAVPALVSLLDRDAVLLWRLSTVSALLALLGWPLSRMHSGGDIQWNEALAITGLAFVIAPMVMVWPLMGLGIEPIDAWFETVSGVTTTGLTTLRDMAERPLEFLFLRAWMQWYGGLGIAALTIALIMRHHAGARRLLETTGESLSDASARSHARRVFGVYLTLTLIAVGAVWASGLPAFSALIHGLAAVATGGFANSDQNIAPLPMASVAVLSAVCVAAAVSLPLVRAAARPRPPCAALRTRGARPAVGDPDHLRWSRGHRRRVEPCDIRGGELDGDGRRRRRRRLVLGVSAQTNTGFSTTDVAALPASAQLMLMVSMAIGGCTGSTAGGIKLIRLLILLRLIQVALQRTATSERAVLDLRVGGDRVQPDMIAGALQLLGLWALVLLASWMIFLLHGQPPMASLFEVVSATSNTGLSAGLTGPELAPLLKLVLTADMLLGRVEILALLVVLYPSTWLGRRRALS